jgi:multidrug resistance efflux pump
MEMGAKRILLALIVIAAVAGAGYLVYQQVLGPAPTAEEPAPFPDTVAADAGAAVVMAEGELTPERYAALSFPVGGRVVEILAEEGDRVRAGEPLLRLEATDLEVRLQEAQAVLDAANAGLESARVQVQSAQAGVETARAGLKAAGARLALVKSPASSEEIAAAENDLRAAEAGVSQAEGNREVALNAGTPARIRAAEANVAAAEAETRALEDFYSHTVLKCVTVEIPAGDGTKREKEICPLYGWVEEDTRFQLEAAQAKLSAARAALEELRAGPTAAQRGLADTAVEVAQAQRDAAQAQLDLLMAAAKPERIRQAEMDVERAELGVTQAQVAVAQAEAALAQSEARVQGAQAAVDGAKAALDKMTLRAVFDGTVAHLSPELGQVVAPGVPMLTLAELDAWVVETTDLIELDVVAVAVGSPARVKIDAFPDATLSGRVTRIASVSRLNRGDVTYAVTITLDEEPALPLRWGMTAFVNISPQSW